MLIFFSPCGLCSRSFCTSLCGGEKKYFLVHKVIRNRSIWGPCQFLIFVTKHLVKNIPIYLSGNMKEFEWKKLEKGRIVWKCEGCFNKMKNIWKNDEFDWKSERICMRKKWKCEEFTWKCEGCLKKNEKYMENDNFVRKSERNYMVQRYSKYRFFDVNCILRYSKYRFSSSIPGMPGEAKISIPYSVWVEDLFYIYIYML